MDSKTSRRKASPLKTIMPKLNRRDLFCSSIIQHAPSAAPWNPSSEKASFVHQCTCDGSTADISGASATVAPLTQHSTDASVVVRACEKGTRGPYRYESGPFHRTPTHSSQPEGSHFFRKIPSNATEPRPSRSEE